MRGHFPPCSAAAAIAQTADRERRRLAQRLHDTSCQSLTGLRLMAEAFVRRLPAESQGALDLRQLIGLIHAAGEEVQALNRELRAAQSTALEVSLAELAGNASKTIPCRFECPAGAPVLEPEATRQLLEIAREAVDNALRHSAASRVRMTLIADSVCATLTVEDDGRGFSLERATSRIGGLDVMRSRATTIGAELEIETAPGAGTSIRCKVFPALPATGGKDPGSDHTGGIQSEFNARSRES